eukprot:1921979-Prymnesium_polylepis.1
MSATPQLVALGTTAGQSGGTPRCRSTAKMACARCRQMRTPTTSPRRARHRAARRRSSRRSSAVQHGDLRTAERLFGPRHTHQRRS